MAAGFPDDAASTVSIHWNRRHPEENVGFFLLAVVYFGGGAKITGPTSGPPPARRPLGGNQARAARPEQQVHPTPPPPRPPAEGSGSVWLVSVLAGNDQTIHILNYFDIGSVESCHFPENKVGLWARGPGGRQKSKQTGRGRGRWDEGAVRSGPTRQPRRPPQYRRR